MPRGSIPWNDRKYAIPVNTRLLTRDGRNIGNAIVTAHVDKPGYFGHTVKTDYGNVCTLTGVEIRDWFYIGTVADHTHKNFVQGVS